MTRLDSVKAARYVRGMGAGKIHPSAKLRLFGLLMQAKRGDYAEEENDGKAEAAKARAAGSEGSATHVLQQLKVKAWRAERGKDRKEAMEEHVQLLTSIAPQWRVESVLAAHDSVKGKKPRRMKFVLRVEFKERKEEEIVDMLQSRSEPGLEGGSEERCSSTLGAPAPYAATSIEVLQGDAAVSAQLWSEKSVTPQEDGLIADVETEDVRDSFIEGMPADLTIEDCVIDKVKHKTIEEQRRHYEQHMLEMAREGRDREDGWESYGETTKDVVEAKRQLEIHQRSVKWSTVKQLRSCIETELSAEEIFASLMDNINGNDLVS